ncbi:Lrp/AsnC family transcriptional regulator [Bordetella avium]|uniref:AsnC/Lrp-family transcriptional regulator n=1 Tax=Bordetella avium (strain 197N) TaxID=360910 RepID=Q2KYU2_BORA1|nr:Lrp/AsnC family transcriptional regulator [Bordetella avium]AZY50765.1 Lrp/AsnC family transcriptional regulator [Bordetella avium]AZY54160.1 Lrp/AsnC family transcriptional regulator [Bordetella avium]RIQ15597.1 Lrp/AsnC family transcriptional regulator [Bordetella avium]RIQ16872.1 Lrp/AsnC family transcriptional regulator [Bordetella avium]RIQ41575.1 Lrp/AsnC family transcriptional regulator [Bordetella avium]
MLLDPLDRRLIALLRTDARLPTAALAKQLAVSRGTIQNRMQRLERAGVITGYTLRMAEHEDQAGVQAVTLIEVHGAATDQVIAALRRLPEATQVHSTNGRWDLVVHLHTADLAAFDRVLRELRGIAGVANSESHLLLAAHR